jgi:hypothetical protein
MDDASIEGVTATILRGLADDEAPTAPALSFLLRQYMRTGRDEIRVALEVALAGALEAWRDADPRARASWLTLFVEAAAASPDERPRQAAGDLRALLSAEWGHGALTETIASGVEACLQAGRVIEPDPLAAAIDELERLIAFAYRPGAGIAHELERNDGPRCLADQVAAASALLTAFERTGRLPYSMLAEELVQFARRTLWDDKTGGFRAGAEATKPFDVNCAAARVCCRLAVLHATDEYRHAAVVARDTDYRADADETLRWLAGETPAQRMLQGMYGLALAEWLDLSL